MNLNISEINEMRPLLILYSSGTGGEFITKTISENSNDFNEVESFIDDNNNLTSARCCLYYGAIWKNPDDPSTWIDHNSIPKDKSKRVVIKDHPSLYFAKYYWRYLSNLQVIHLAVNEEIDYFSKLTMNKLAYRVNSDDVDKVYINKYISETATQQRIDDIVNWAKSCHWVWSTELQTLNSLLSKEVDVSNFCHNDDIDILIKHQSIAMSWESGQLRTFLSDIYDNYTTVYVDSLASDGIDFWNQIKVCIPNLELSKCLEKTTEWIDHNNKVMSRGPRTYNE